MIYFLLVALVASVVFVILLTVIIFIIDTKRYENYVKSIKDAYEKAVEDEI